MPSGSFGGASWNPGQVSNSFGQQGYTPNPYLTSQINGLEHQYNNNLTRNLLPAIQSGAAAVGGIGGSRQGIAQGLAVGDSQAGFANAASNLMGQSYENDQNRALQAYGMNSAQNLGMLNSDRNYALGVGGLNNQYGLGMGNLGLGYTQAANQYSLGQQQNANNRYGLDLNYQLGVGNQGLENQNQQLNFFNQQGSQDIQRYLAQLQGYQVGTNSPWGPLTNFGQITSPYTGNGTTTQDSSQGGGALGGFGGALGAMQLWQLMNGGH
jgi:hypothetical protein